MRFIGKSQTRLLLWVVGLIVTSVAAWQFYLFVMFRDSRGFLDPQGGGPNLWLGVGAIGAACVCLFLGIFNRINQTEEFHINFGPRALGWTTTKTPVRC